jgi:hypothetical protein
MLAAVRSSIFVILTTAKVIEPIYRLNRNHRRSISSHRFAGFGSIRPLWIMTPYSIQAAPETTADETVTDPKFDVLAIKKPLGVDHRLSVVATDHGLVSYKMSIFTDGIRPIFLHGSYSKGRNSPPRSLATSGERNGSPPAQSRHWKLRPPVLRSKNRMGFLHLGQSGAGAFLGM